MIGDQRQARPTRWRSWQQWREFKRDKRWGNKPGRFQVGKICQLLCDGIGAITFHERKLRAGRQRALNCRFSPSLH
jgi:hypothetical protein